MTRKSARKRGAGRNDGVPLSSSPLKAASPAGTPVPLAPPRPSSSDRIDPAPVTDTVRRGIASPIRVAIPVLGIAGMGIASYLTYVHYKAVATICLFNGKCDVVLTSSYAQMWGVSLSVFGLVMYAVIAGLGLWLLFTKSEWEHLISLGTYAVALAGIIFTGYLYYLEAFVLHAFCTWCITSSIVLVTIFVLSIISFRSTGRAISRTPHARRFKLSDYVQW